MMEVFRYSTPVGFDDLLMYTDDEVLTGLLFAGSRDKTDAVKTCHSASLQ